MDAVDGGAADSVVFDVLPYRPGGQVQEILHREIEGAIPGLEDPDEAPSGTIAANRRNSIGICHQHWPTVRPQEDQLDCDEYPFASTKEGSLSANGNFSVRYISNSDNRNQATSSASSTSGCVGSEETPSGFTPIHFPRIATPLLSADDRHPLTSWPVRTPGGSRP
ncbi:NucA/NucB deoxyribonuclease domain-containing protein [Acrocarpospora sp. B8E8]|uniref:NucA/NucB deoxyribonuclease domain-containing protein n=1 Tax=Acrocarpospora sp. B8E8 TaxID=3153572 RepID=UPI00325E6F52